jgi:predicted Fe-Mo cluster-binding NifX family protein
MSRIAVPLASGRFTTHFGAAEQFALFDVDGTTRSIAGHQVIAPPAHERGVFPVWLRDQGVTTVLAGSMGPRAMQAFDRFGIEVALGIEYGSPEGLVQDYLLGLLQTSGGPCEGGGFHDCAHHDRELQK